MSSRAVTIAGFLALAAAALGLELLGRRPGSPVPRLGDLVGRAVQTRRGRIGVLLAWWWVGWHLFAR
jgi:hypothetical protein